MSSAEIEDLLREQIIRSAITSPKNKSIKKLKQEVKESRKRVNVRRGVVKDKTKKDLLKEINLRKKEMEKMNKVMFNNLIESVTGAVASQKRDKQAKAVREQKERDKLQLRKLRVENLEFIKKAEKEAEFRSALTEEVTNQLEKLTEKISRKTKPPTAAEKKIIIKEATDFFMPKVDQPGDPLFGQRHEDIKKKRKVLDVLEKKKEEEEEEEEDEETDFTDSEEEEEEGEEEEEEEEGEEVELEELIQLNKDDIINEILEKRKELEENKEFNIYAVPVISNNKQILNKIDTLNKDFDIMDEIIGGVPISDFSPKQRKNLNIMKNLVKSAARNMGKHINIVSRIINKSNRKKELTADEKETIQRAKKWNFILDHRDILENQELFGK